MRGGPDGSAAPESDEEKAARQANESSSAALPSLPERMFYSAGFGLAAGVLAGILIGVVESIVIAQGGLGEEAQVFWYGPLAYAVVLGGLATVGGAVLGVLPMERLESQSRVPALGLAATLIPFGLAITIFRLERDVYLEQMPPAPVLLGVLIGAAVLALLIVTVGHKLFSGRGGVIVQPTIALGLLAAVMVIGVAVSSSVGESTKMAGRDPIPAALRSAPNIILIMVDTLRADHLWCYGGQQVSTPNLCSLAEGDGQMYQAFSHASWTKPATASLLTSTLPSRHRAIAGPSTLSPDVDLIAEVMQDHGYTTGGIVTNVNLTDRFGFDRGYDEYDFLGPRYLAGAEESSSRLILYDIVRAVWLRARSGLHFSDFYQDSEVVNDVAFEWLGRHEEDRFFLFLHYMDLHDPYFEHPYNGNGIARVSNPHPDESLASEMHRLYNGEIEYLDANMGKLFDELKAMGLYDETVIALTSDHGEEFFEHGGWWHGLTLYEEQIHVPLLIKWAKSQGPAPEGATDGIARLIDVAPTLIAAAGAQTPPSMQGIDLRSVFSSRAEKDREAFAQEDHEGNVLWSIRTENMKLIGANPGNPRGLPEREAFAIRRDPRELRPLDPDQLSDETDRLEQRADLQRRAAEGEAVADAGELEMSYEECEQLRMLGYVDDCSQLEH